jgi:DNA-binding MarR family transcriptional regulator
MGVVKVKSERDVAELAREIETGLRVIQRAMRRPLRAEIARGKFTAPQMAILGILVRSDGLSLKELSRRAALAHSTVSGIVDRLEERELVAREPDPADARFSRIVVTEPVRAFVHNKLPELTVQPLTEALRRATPAQRAKIADGLRTLRGLLGDEG